MDVLSDTSSLSRLVWGSGSQGSSSSGNSEIEEKPLLLGQDSGLLSSPAKRNHLEFNDDTIVVNNNNKNSEQEASSAAVDKMAKALYRQLENCPADETSSNDDDDNKQHDGSDVSGSSSVAVDDINTEYYDDDGDDL